MILRAFAIPAIEMASQEFKNKDENDTGTDDMIGLALQFCADILKAVLGNQPLPSLPEGLEFQKAGK